MLIFLFREITLKIYLRKTNKPTKNKKKRLGLNNKRNNKGKFGDDVKILLKVV